MIYLMVFAIVSAVLVLIAVACVVCWYWNEKVVAKRNFLERKAERKG